MAAGSSLSESTAWLQRLPKAELHLHLEGTVSPETLVVLSQRHDSEPLSLATAQALYNYTDFLHFLRTFKLVTELLLTSDDYALITYEMIRDLAAQGVVHAEVFVAFGGIQRGQRQGLSFEKAMQGAEQGRIKAETEFGVSILWIIDATRHDGVPAVGEIFQAAAELRQKFPSIVGVGIGGSEVDGPCRLFSQQYAEAKAAGLRLTAHAGEATGVVGGPAEIRDALEMSVERLGHALEARHDAELVEKLRQLQIPLELNVTSNVRTGCLSSVKQHPLRRYFDVGLLVSINSDDPAMFGSNLLEEYILVHGELGFSRKEMKQLARNSFSASFLTPARKKEFIAQLEQYDD